MILLPVMTVEEVEVGASEHLASLARLMPHRVVITRPDHADQRNGHVRGAGPVGPDTSFGCEIQCLCLANHDEVTSLSELGDWMIR